MTNRMAEDSDKYDGETQRRNTIWKHYDQIQWRKIHGKLELEAVTKNILESRLNQGAIWEQFDEKSSG
jgi:hypothetical protein